MQRLKIGRFTIKWYIIYTIVSAFAIAAFAQDIQISGNVTDTAGNGIGGVSVRLAVANFSTISDSNGKYDINGTTDVISTVPNINFNIAKFSNKNKVYSSLSDQSFVKLNAYTLNGKAVNAILNRAVDEQVCSGETFYANGLYLLKAQTQSTDLLFRVLSCGTHVNISNTKSVSNNTADTRFAKTSSISDSLVASKIGYKTARESVSSYKLTNKAIVLSENPPNKPYVVPGGNFDLSIWSLQLPTGSGTSVTTIRPDKLTGTNGFTDSNYFYTASDGAMTFMDPQQGITTSGSIHCRTELREMTGSGDAAAWSSDGTNVMSVIGEVLQVGGGSGGHVVLGQVYNSSSSIPLCAFEYFASTGGFKVLYEEAKGAGTYIDLGVSCPLKTRYTVSLGLTHGVLTVTVNEKLCYTKVISLPGVQYYFKCGAYDQTATAGIPDMKPYTVVIVHALNVEHYR